MNVKTAIIVTLIALAIVPAFGSTVEVGTNLTTGIVSIQTCVQKPIGDDGLGAFVYTCNSRYWGEAYAGLTFFKPGAVNVEIALGYGVEQALESGRIGGWIWMGKDRLSAIYLFEDGGSGPWHRVVAKYAISPSFALGYIEKSRAGEGIYGEYKLTKDATIKYSGFKAPELALAVRF